MPDDATKIMGVDRWQLDLLADGSTNRGKGVAIVEAKRRKLMTTAADFEGFLQSQVALP